MHAVDQKALNDAAWKACDTFRGVVDPAQYKDYILTFLFWKYVSDLWLDHKLAFEREFAGDVERVARKMRFERFNLAEESTFQAVYAQRNADNVGELINIALQAIEDRNRTKLAGALTNVDFNSTNNLGETSDRNRRLRNLFADFAKPALDFAPSRFNGDERAEDAIGETYIYLISQFASDAGKKAGEFFTPRRVSELLVRLADPEPGMRICDPACGSASLLIRAAEHIAGKSDVETARADVKLFGQEATRQTQGLARMNMFLHGLDDARIEWGDTLNNPKLIDRDALMRFDLLIANPPFSLDKWGAENATADRWRRYQRGIPPKGRGDFAFISHMVEAAKPRHGRVAVIMPHAVLWRGGVEGRIRQKLIEENLVDGIVALPEQLFPSTDTGVVLLILDRAREKGGSRENADDVMFIDASEQFDIGKLQNHLSDQHIERILTAWSSRADEERYARCVPLADIREHGFNLNIWKYVDTVPPEQTAQIDLIEEEILTVEARLKEIRALLSSRNGTGALLPADDYGEIPLGELLSVRTEVGTGAESVHSVSVKKGLVDQVEHLGRSVAAADTSNYRLVRPGDVVYTKSPTGNFPLGIVRQSQLDQDAIVSPLYAVYEPLDRDVGFLLDRYFASPYRALKYMRPIVHKGAKNTISVSDREFLNGKVLLPSTTKGRAYLAEYLRLVTAESALQARLALLVGERGYFQSVRSFLGEPPAARSGDTSDASQLADAAA